VARSVGSGANIATFDATSTIWPFMREGTVNVVFSPLDETRYSLRLPHLQERTASERRKLYSRGFSPRSNRPNRVIFGATTSIRGWFPAADVLQDRQCLSGVRHDAGLITDLRKRFEAYTGPPVNKGGVR